MDHNGALFGYRTETLRFPEQKFTIVCLCNVSNANPESRARKVADIYLEKDLQPVPTASSSSDPTLFAGKYFDRRNHYLLSYSTVGGNLVVQGGILTPIAPNRFEGPTSYFSTFSSSKGAANVTVKHDNQTTFSGSRNR
ncbi:MAG TPA: hypothetical protein VFQ43_10950 [Nitrososphaera sp.]|nr:hypothetical protein [Nitrososphaera sp.]